MGEMSGIELVRKARSISSDMVSILISGYPEFSYAKEAISLDVADYLLKPVRQEELTAALSKAVTKVMHQRNLLKLLVHKDNFSEELLSGEQKEQLHALLNGIETKLDFSAAMLFLGKTYCFQIGLFRISLQQELGGKGSVKPDFEWLRGQVQDIIREIGGQCFLPFNNFAQKQLVTVIAASPYAEHRKAKDYLAKTFEKIYHQIHTRLKVILHIGVSGITQTVSGTMMTQARQALDLRLSFVSGLFGRIFYWEEWDMVASSKLLEEDFKLYQCALSKGDLNNTLDAVRRIFSSEAMDTALHIRMLYVDLICILARTCIKKVGGSVVSMLGPESLGGGVIDQFADKEEMIESLCRTITTALSQWMPVNADATLVLQNVKSYIEHNFSNNELCTSLLSNNFCISLGYLSTSYRNEFGVTISKYIISLRVDYAKKLLGETRLSIAETAENSGFNNLSYFMRTFKKYVGDTPAEYREKLISPAKKQQSAVKKL
jgi:two-component system response regulator YesN